MSKSQCVKALRGVLLFLATVTIARSMQAKEDERLFEKALPSKQKIIVLRHELEGAAKAQAQQNTRDRAKLLPPGVTSPVPDHFYTITYTLSSADGKTQRDLWQMARVGYDKSPKEFTVFDASYEAPSATLVLVYKAGGGTYAEVVDTKTTKATGDRQVPMILRDSESVGAVVMSVALSGSLAKGNLTASATNNLAEQYTLRWSGTEWKLIDFKPSLTSKNPNIKQNLPFSPNEYSF